MDNGIDVTLDQCELKPGDDLAHFMEVNLEKADKIVIVCSDNYVTKANKGKGGVAYEKMILASTYLKVIKYSKLIPVLRNNSNESLPTFLKSKLYIDFSLETNFEFNFDELIRVIHEAPVLKKLKVGNNPFKSVNE